MHVSRIQAGHPAFISPGRSLRALVAFAFVQLFTLRIGEERDAKSPVTSLSKP